VKERAGGSHHEASNASSVSIRVRCKRENRRRGLVQTKKRDGLSLPSLKRVEETNRQNAQRN